MSRDTRATNEKLVNYERLRQVSVFQFIMGKSHWTLEFF